ncbi:translation elongation factor Ts [Mycoplasmopsis arginini]|uniref:translation elongation factor Ts n=1 Tax=Mycoplasmopsis arginini TaxID=2094 RepID=UPI00249EA995|nr:translation elongation factor Ts [Mycoplasmopsis arginini]MDI3348341.1 elongation factor Ts [Mycoplasmopsis arginini]MDI3348957.1 elongation factor Ts [Mycoplasmopsis arginini]
MSVDLNKIKELRERTNLGFLDVKKALEANDNDVEKSIDWLQEKGILKAAKKAGRIAAEGIVRALVKDNVAVIFELNSETDFVSKNELFIELANKIGEALFTNDFSTNEELLAIKIDGVSIEDHTSLLTAKIGEKITLRRALKYVAKEGEIVTAYTHANNRVATIIIGEGSNQEALRNISMHITALNPSHLFESCLCEVELKEIHDRLDASPALANKPEKIQQSIKAGLLRKELNEKGVLLYQPFVMDDSKTVAQYLEDSKLKLINAKRFEVGEGIEKKTVDFAAEVAEQMAK